MKENVDTVKKTLSLLTPNELRSGLLVLFLVMGMAFLETIGAVFAGLILGYLSLRKGSIFTGIALHFSVAITMDVLALYHLGFL